MYQTHETQLGSLVANDRLAPVRPGEQRRALIHFVAELCGRRAAGAFPGDAELEQAICTIEAAIAA